MKTQVAAAALAFAFAATVCGGARLQLTANPAPAPGLESYTVTAVSTDSSNLVTFSDIHIDDPVHHVWGYGDDPITTREHHFPSTFLKAEWSAYDTHLLVAEEDILTHLHPHLDEGNDGSNPAGLVLELDPPLTTSVPVIGLGRNGHGQQHQHYGSFALLPHAEARTVDLLQVVLLEGTEALLTLAVVAGMDRSQLSLVIPEPATLSLLALGGLAAFRRRR